MENPSSTEQKVTISPLTRFNWEQVLELELHDYQEDFLPSNLYSLAQSRFEDLEPFGIFLDGKMVGFLMYGEFSGVCWINRVMIDRDYQEKGIGYKAVELLLGKLARHPKCGEIRTSFARQNALAEYFFGKLGFQKISDGLDGEIVMRWVK